MSTMNASNTSTAKLILGLAIIGILVFGTITVLNMPDRRTSGERIGDAIDSLSSGEGVGNAARELQDRTPGEKLGDAVKDTGNKIKDVSH